jgi:hypothetical protein
MPMRLTSITPVQMVGVHAAAAAAGANGMEVDSGNGSKPGGRKLSVGYQALSAKQIGMEVRLGGVACASK